jgi:predicted PurR-regulated permease PerM
MKIPRVSLHHHPKNSTTHDGVELPPPTRNERFVVELDAEQLREVSAVFASPRWLRDLGLAAWFLVGVALLLVGLTWVLGVTSTIVLPVLCGGVVATVASPLVSLLQRHRVPRALGALITLLLLIALGVLIVLLVLGGIVAEGDKIASALRDGVDKMQSWVQSLGVDNNAASSANEAATSSAADTFHTLWSGLADGIRGIASLAFGLSFTVFALFFLLKDGPALREWLNGHLGVPRPIAQTITRDVVHSIRRYFLGVSIVAGFNSIVVGLGAIILGVPLAGTIAVVTLVTAYIPFIGAVVAGAFAVLLALGTQGTTTALIMLVIVILANGMLQNIVSPIAMGATLQMNPLLILVVTISAGAFFGTAGMVLAAPLTSAAIHISSDLARVRAAAKVAQDTTPPPLVEPG